MKFMMFDKSMMRVSEIKRIEPTERLYEVYDCDMMGAPLVRAKDLWKISLMSKCGSKLSEEFPSLEEAEKRHDELSNLLIQGKLGFIVFNEGFINTDDIFRVRLPKKMIELYPDFSFKQLDKWVVEVCLNHNTSVWEDFPTLEEAQERYQEVVNLLANKEIVKNER
jgi:hypothetical protein